MVSCSHSKGFILESVNREPDDGTVEWRPLYEVRLKAGPATDLPCSCISFAAPEQTPADGAGRTLFAASHDGEIAAADYSRRESNNAQQVHNNRTLHKTHSAGSAPALHAAYCAEVARNAVCAERGASADAEAGQREARGRRAAACSGALLQHRCAAALALCGRAAAERRRLGLGALVGR